MRKVIAILLCFLSMTLNLSHADMFHDYVEYRCQPNLGKITILTSFVRGVRAVDYISDNWDIMEKENIFIHGPHFVMEARVFERSDKIGDNQINSTFTLYPPRGMGMGGALPTTYLTVEIDGVKKIDCNIGCFPGSYVEVTQITICPEDDAIFIDAADRITGEKFSDHFINISDPTIITNEYIKTSGIESDYDVRRSDPDGDHEVGAIYKDADGRKAEYLGNGKWQMR
jgi:hypothetical protein